MSFRFFHHKSAETRRFQWSLILVLLCFCGSKTTRADTLAITGVLGNSGEAGKALLRSQYTVPTDHAARFLAGIYADGDSFWVSGGDAVERVSMGGKLLERFPLPENAEIRSSNFAALDGVLYFLGVSGPYAPPQLFALPMKNGAQVEAVMELPKNNPDWQMPVLCAQTANGKLLLAWGGVDGEQDIPAKRTTSIYALDPAQKQLEKLFTMPGAYPSGLVYHDGVLTIGAAQVAGTFESPTWHNIIRRDLAGNVPAGEDGKGKPSFGSPVVPTWYPGRISLAGGALWDFGSTFGFVGRRETSGAASPGLVWRWEHAFDVPIQMTDVPGCDAMALASDAPDAFHLLRWNADAQKLEAVRRYGSLPRIYSLGISPDGKVTVGTSWTQLWWNWNDEPSTPPLFSDMLVAASPPIWNGEKFFAFSWKYNAPPDDEKTAPAAFVFGATRSDGNAARAVVEDMKRFDFKQPTGATFLAAPGKDQGVLLVTDAETKTLRALSYDRHEQRPEFVSRAVPIDGAALQSPADVCALPDGRVLLADAGHVLLLEPTGEKYSAEGYKVLWSWNGGENKFGDSIGIAVDGDKMLLADTNRQRVLLCDWAGKKILAQVGQTDKAGDDAAHFDTPTLVALRDGRGVVADSGNQRVLTLSVR